MKKTVAKRRDQGSIEVIVITVVVGFAGPSSIDFDTVSLYCYTNHKIVSLLFNYGEKQSLRRQVSASKLFYKVAS